MENQLTGPTGAKINKVEPAQKTYFFERWDGKTFHVQEREAWNVLKNRQPVVGLFVQPPKYLGCSDGTLFQKAVLEAHALFAEGKMEEAQARLRQGEAEELEMAKKNKEMPRNFDTIDKNSQPFQF